MPPRAAELHHISPYLLIWHAFDQAAKTELFSTAVISDDAIIIIDPIALTDLAERELNGCGRVASIILTNVNHVRGAISFHQRYAAPILATVELTKEVPNAQPVNDRTAIHNQHIVELDSLSPGENPIPHPSD